MVPSEDEDKAEETAREFAAQFLHESFEDAAGMLSDAGREAVVASSPNEFPEEPEDAENALEQYWWGLYGQYGDFEDVGDVAVENGEGDESAEVTVELVFEDGTETATVRVDDDGVSASAASGGSSDGRSESDGVADLSFDPSYEEPAYADQEAFAEREVTVDAGDVELDGVLAVPEGEGSVPGVLLVHGAGIHDPDGTAGASKILRDFAHALASDGIASLRYEKRLREHEVDDENYTLDNVVTDDAVAAADALADADEVDADSLFVAGHSQGGMTAPRIADRHGDVAGIVNLDGTSEPIVDPDDLRFMQYGFEVDGDLSEEQEEELEAQRETFRRIANGDFDADDTIMGKPGVWHQSHHDCEPVTTASGLDAPMFVLKTGRADEKIQAELYEVLRERFEEWQAADLPAGSRCEFYRDVGHYFQDGPTPMTFHHLYFGGNVADYVVEDVTEWIHDVAGE